MDFFSLPHLLVILLIVLVIFGGAKLPELGKGLGSAIRNFKKAAAGEDEIDVTPKPKVEGKEKEEAKKDEKGA